MAKKLTSAKAKEILHDKSVHGHPLTDKQRRFFGAIAGGAEPYKAQIGTMLTALPSNMMDRLSDALAFPQRAITKLFTGEYQTPSEAMKIQNPVGAAATDILLDPVNLLGAGIAGKAAKASTESGVLSKAYKINPWAFKSDPEAGYRMIGGKEGLLDAISSGEIRPTSQYEHAHFNIGQPLNPNRLSAEELIKAGSPGGYKGPYMAEMKQGTWQRMSDAFSNNPEIQEQLKLLGKDKDVWQHPLFGNIKVDDPRLKLYKEHWLKGYKEVPKIKKKEEGGWLDKYEQGGLVLKQKTHDNYGTKPNVNNDKATYPDGFVGMGNNLKGRNYSPAWGGQFQDGGYIDSVLNANKKLDWVQRLYEKNTPSIQIKGQKGRSTHFMESADNRVYPTVVRENGKLKYIGDKAYDYADSTKTYIEFPSEKEATWFAENYKKGTNVLKKENGGNLMPAMAGANQTVPMFQMGGSLPGAVGFMYARTQNPAPSNGPYAKKTKASAQDGKEVMKGEDYVKGWMNSPMYNQMLSASASGEEYDRISKGRVANLSQPRLITSTSTLPEGTLGQASIRVRNLINATFQEREELMSALQKSINNPKDKDAKRLADKLMQPTVTGWDINMSNKLKPGTVDYESVLAHEIGHTTDRPLIKLPNQMSNRELRETNVEDFRNFIPVLDMEKMSGYNKDKLTRDFNKYVANPAETRQFLNDVRYLGKQQGIYDPFTQKITPEQYRRIKSTEYLDPIGILSNIYTEDQIIDMLNSISKKQNVSGGVPTAQNGQEMKYYQEGLDFKPKTISQDGAVIDPEGYWNPENWGNPVIIPSTDITMEGVDQPLIGISDTGDVQYMEPGEDYTFDGDYVTEYPVAKKGISVNNADAQPIKKLDQSLNFTNYNKPTKGGWLDKYQ